MVGCLQQDVLEAAVVRPDGFGQRGHLGGGHGTAGLARRGQALDQAALADGGGQLEVGHFLLLGLQGEVGLAVLLAGFGQFLLPQRLRLLVLPLPLAAQAGIPVLGGVEQRGGEGHDSLARTGRGHDGQVEVGRILHPLVEEAHAG